MRGWEDLKFDNSAIQYLPVDSNAPRGVRKSVPGYIFSRVDLQPVSEPCLVCTSTPAFRLLDLDPKALDVNETAEILSGNRSLGGSEQYAHSYSGYQFGSFAGALGDGAATSLGEILNTSGERWELQLKGAGVTPYSRQGDGRKVLRSCIREFLASEAMYHLGIPTTRAASVVTSSSKVIRDALYNGDPGLESVSLMLRLAPSFLRFGSFEIFKDGKDSNTDVAGPSASHLDLLPQLLNYTIFNHFPTVWQACGGGESVESPPEDTVEMYLLFYRTVVQRTAQLVAHWQCVGFCHGVLNTDNMSILGLTLDYGPFGFLDRYHREHISNVSDHEGRYCFGQQPQMCNWNCQQLMEILRHVLPNKNEIKMEFGGYWPHYHKSYHDEMMRKLGLLSDDERDLDDELIEEFHDAMQQSGADFTTTFRRLADVPIPDAPPTHDTITIEADTEVRADDLTRVTQSHESRDGGFLKYVLSNTTHPSEAAAQIDSKVPGPKLKLLSLLASRQPALLQSMGLYQQVINQELDKHEQASKLRRKTPEEKFSEDSKAWSTWLQRYLSRLWRERSAGTTPEQRRATMNAVNPNIVLRNWVAQAAIEAAENEDYTLVDRVQKLLETPFKDVPADDLVIKIAPRPVLPFTTGDELLLHWQLNWPPPPKYKGLEVSCSS